MSVFKEPDPIIYLANLQWRNDVKGNARNKFISSKEIREQYGLSDETERNSPEWEAALKRYAEKYFEDLNA